MSKVYTMFLCSSAPPVSHVDIATECLSQLRAVRTSQSTRECHDLPYFFCMSLAQQLRLLNTHQQIDAITALQQVMHEKTNEAKDAVSNNWKFASWLNFHTYKKCLKTIKHYLQSNLVIPNCWCRPFVASPWETIAKVWHCTIRISSTHTLSHSVAAYRLWHCAVKH